MAVKSKSSKARKVLKRSKPPAASTAAGPEPTLKRAFPIVGVGASAGGLEAFTGLLKALPPDPGMAFVFILHMAPTHVSMLPKLLSKSTKMPVREVTDGMRVAPNQVYIIPPNAGLAISGGILRLVARKEGTSRILPIDDFLESLAEDQKSRAIGVILSGTASDGTQGLKAIKAEGGITFAEDEKSARFADMPRNAVAAGCVDFSLPPDQIAAELARVGRHPYVQQAIEAEPDAEGTQETLRRICLLLRTTTGVDLHLYKPATIGRRVARRMALHKTSSREQYLRMLRENRAELDALYEDLFIHVTSFFRDAEALQAVLRILIPRILERPEGDPAIRVWVPGCSSGEEVYTVAMLLLAELRERSSQKKIQIFGTDISERAIEYARAGNYSETGMGQVSQERKRRFFVKGEGGYQIVKSVRDMCVFARHDLTKDPPFSRMDLICCRNVLIYLGPVLQRRVAETFHYALKPVGNLVLGKSESLSAYSNLFSTEDAKLKIFSRLPVSGLPYLNTVSAAYGKGDRAGLAPIPAPPFDLRREAERLLLEEYVPAALVIDSDLQIIHFQGKTSPFLAPATGQPSFHLLRMVRPELVVALRTAVHEAKSSGSTIRRAGIRLKQNGASRTVDLEVTPVRAPDRKEPNFLVVFQQAAEPQPAESPSGKGAEAKGRAGARIEQLKRELNAAQEQLRTIIEENEAAREEMTAVNEEIVSGNEELQSTNEELETAKEELQSSNEELITLNDELQSRNVELGQLTNDLSNLLVGVDIPVVILDSDLRIRRFTPVAGTMLNLISSDVGRPFSDIASTLDLTNWNELVSEVMVHHRVVEREVRDRSGHWYGLRMRPYRAGEDQIGGLLLALLDIDVLKRSLNAAREARDFAEAIVETIREPVLVLDSDLRVVTATHRYYEGFRTSAAETEGHLFFDLGGGQWNVPRLREVLEEVLSRDTQFNNFEVVEEFPQIGRRIMVLNARRLQWGSEDAQILLAMEDITERGSEEMLRQRDRVIQDATSQGILSVGPDGRIVMANLRAAEMFGYGEGEMLGLPMEMLLPARFRVAHAAQRGAFLADLTDRPMEARLEPRGVRKDGSEFPIAVTLGHIETRDGIASIDIITDLSDQKRTEEELHLSQEQLALAQEAAGVGVWDWDGPSNELRQSGGWGPLYGFPQGTAVPRPEQWMALIHPDDRERVREIRRRALENGKPYSKEFRVVWPDGSVHWQQSRATVLRDKFGKAVRMFGATLDITSSKRAEEERQALADRLAHAQEEERWRISRELHDNLTQRLASLAIDLGGLVAEFPSVSEKLKKRLRSTQGSVVQAAEVARHIAYELHPAELDDLGLAAALRSYCEDFAREGTQVEFTSRNLPATLPREIASCLYRVAQESLRNVSKHAKATRASVVLEGLGNRIRLRVGDRGVGFPLKSLGASGLGILGMRERVRLVNGSFALESQPGKGTRITVILPLPG